MTGVPAHPAKDARDQQPVPLAWRPVVRAVVDAIRRGDARLAADVPSVGRVTAETAADIRDQIADYGEQLVALPEASWASSVVLWLGDFWEVLVDLWTEAEGRSDLVLHLRVYEDGSRYRFEVETVHVP